MEDTTHRPRPPFSMGFGHDHLLRERSQSMGHGPETRPDLRDLLTVGFDPATSNARPTVWRGTTPMMVVIDEGDELGQAVTPKIAEQFRVGLPLAMGGTVGNGVDRARIKEVMDRLVADGVFQRPWPDGPLDVFEFVAVEVFGATVTSASDTGSYSMRCYSWTGSSTAYMAEMCRRVAKWMPFDVSEMCGPDDRLHLFSITYTRPVPATTPDA